MILGTHDFGKLDLYLPADGTCGDKGDDCDCPEPDCLARKINCKGYSKLIIVANT